MQRITIKKALAAALALVLMLTAVFVFAACGPEESTEVTLSSIAVTTQPTKTT